MLPGALLLAFAQYLTIDVPLNGALNEVMVKNQTDVM